MDTFSKFTLQILGKNQHDYIAKSQLWLREALFSFKNIDQKIQSRSGFWIQIFLKNLAKKKVKSFHLPKVAKAAADEVCLIFLCVVIFYY